MSFSDFESLSPALYLSDVDDDFPLTPDPQAIAEAVVEGLDDDSDVEEAAAVPLPSAPAVVAAPQPLGKDEAALRVQRLIRGVLSRKKTEVKRRAKQAQERFRQIQLRRQQANALLVGASRRSSGAGASSSDNGEGSSGANPKKKSKLRKCKHCGTMNGSRAKECKNKDCAKPLAQSNESKWAAYSRKKRRKVSWDKASKKQKLEFALSQLDLCFICRDPVNYNPSTTICTGCKTGMCIKCAKEFAYAEAEKAFPVFRDNPNDYPVRFGKWKKPCACQEWAKFPVINPVVADDGTKPSLDADNPRHMRRTTIPSKVKQLSLWDRNFLRSVTVRQNLRSYDAKVNAVWMRCIDLGLFTVSEGTTLQEAQAEVFRIWGGGHRNLLSCLEHLVQSNFGHPSASSSSNHSAAQSQAASSSSAPPAAPLGRVYGEINLEKMRENGWTPEEGLGLNIAEHGSSVILGPVVNSSHISTAYTNMQPEMIIRLVKSVKYLGTTEDGRRHIRTREVRPKGIQEFQAFIRSVVSTAHKVHFVLEPHYITV